MIAEINLDRHAEDVVQAFEQAVAATPATPAIVSGWSTTGAADHVMKVLVSDIAGYGHLLHSVAFKLPSVTHLRSSVVLKEVRAETRLPIAHPTDQRTRRTSARPCWRRCAAGRGCPPPLSIRR